MPEPGGVMVVKISLVASACAVSADPNSSIAAPMMGTNPRRRIAILPVIYTLYGGRPALPDRPYSTRRVIQNSAAVASLSGQVEGGRYRSSALYPSLRERLSGNPRGQRPLLTRTLGIRGASFRLPVPRER